MKKIAIVTISHGQNYGNKLQNYAMQEVYKKIGFDVETIKFDPNANKKMTMYSKITKMLKKTILFFIKPIKQKNVRNRIKNFKSFDEQHLINTKETFNNDNYNNINTEKYDFFSAGSDQIWNPYFNSFSEYYLLNFVEKKKKFSYAASFGVELLPDSSKEKFKKSLLDFKNISVREEKGKSIIKELINKDAQVVLDPTLLLNRQEWLEIAQKPKNMTKKRYICLYFLGNISKQRKKEIKRFAIENKMKIINIYDRYSNFFASGPSEFLYIIKNAELILTDSFHAAVFSIIMNRPFLIFNRDEQLQKMNSRIDTLLGILKLDDRRYNGRLTNENLRFDYSQAYKIIEEEKEKSINYLKKALEIDKKDEN